MLIYMHFELKLIACSNMLHTKRFWSIYLCAAHDSQVAYVFL
jgi:hypothetical protein